MLQGRARYGVEDVSEQVTAYQNALRKMDTAVIAAQRIASIVEAAGKALSTWQVVTVTNISTGGGYPSGLHRAGMPSIDATTWPTIEQIHAALVAFHDAKVVVKNAWNAIPAEDRIGLTSPPDPR